MATWVRRRFKLFVVVRVWCARCGHEFYTLRFTRGAAEKVAIAHEVEHYDECPARAGWSRAQAPKAGTR